MFTLSLPELAFLFLTLFLALFAVRSDDIEVHAVEKRAPGWGKRDMQQNKLGYLNSVLADLSRYELSKNDLDNLDLSKRRPGWGKRGLSEDLAMDKRRPGWGKRGLTEDLDMDKRRPGWGKRSNSFDMDEILQKRTPGWGKRSFELDEDFEDGSDHATRSKRRPGWGKRSYLDDTEAMEKRRPGWGKRTPGWGKRSVPVTRDCSDILNSIRLLSLRLSLLKDELSDTCPVQSDQLLQQSDSAFYKA